MRNLFFHITLILVLMSAGINAQVIDTTKSINAWKLMHNYSRFEDTNMDTTIYDLRRGIIPLYRNGIAYESLGSLGHAAQNLYFFDRPGLDQFLFGNSLQPYLANPDRTIFYNTRKPYTEIAYSTTLASQWGEETLRFLHTQNMDPFTNIGLDFEVLSGKELYDNEKSRVAKFTLFGSRAKNKYSAFGSFHFNSLDNSENGGLADTESFLSNTYSAPWLNPMKLSDGLSAYKNLQLFYTQKFAITEKISTTDTLGVTTVTGKNLSFNHQFNAISNKRTFEDYVSLSERPDIYQNFYFYDQDVKDSVAHDQISNTLQIILGDPYTDPLSARIYAGHEFIRFGQRSPEQYQYFSGIDTLSYDPILIDSVFRDTAAYGFNNKFFNELFIGFHMAGPPERPWYWNVDAKYYVAGYYQHNFSANATFSRAMFENYRFGVRGGIQNRNTSYYHNHYASTFFKWDNDFKASQLIKAEAFLNSPQSEFEASANIGLITNYLYWDENALPSQYEDGIMLLTAKLSKRFVVSGFNSHNELLLQYTTADDVLRLPLAAFKTSNYWQQILFNGALTTQIGVDLYITTPYTGNAYMPATGVFYLQDERLVGGYPFLDAFVAIRIKRTRIFASVNNGLAGLVSNNYFTLADYPAKPLFFRFGLAWTFYD